MDDLRKAAEMALEALEFHQRMTRPIAETQIAINTLRQALSQPEQEPVAWIKVWDEKEKKHILMNYYPIPSSKPWIGLTQEEIAEIQYSTGTQVEYELFDEGEYGTEINIYPEKFARAIEAKLKEKNT